MLVIITGIAFFIFVHRLSLGPSFPKLSTYRNIDKAAIASEDESAQSTLAQDIQKFQQSLLSLSPAGSETFDGCGLFVTEESGDFPAAYGKVCTLYRQSYYASNDSVRTTVGAVESVIGSLPMYPEQQCNDTPIKRYNDMSEFSVYTLDSTLAATDALNCSKLSRLDTASPAFSSGAVLAGAVGADEAYQEVRAQSVVNRKVIMDQMRARGVSTIVIVQWSKRYYSHTF